MIRNKNTSPRCNSILYHMCSHISLLAFIYLIYLFFPTIVNSIKSHPPHSLCGLLRTRGREAGDWDVGERLPRMKNVLSHVYETSCRKGVRGNYLGLGFLRVCCCGPILPVLLILVPKLTRMRPDLHKQTVGDLCHLAYGCQLQQPPQPFWLVTS